MLRTVPVPDQRLVDDYLEPAGEEAVERLRAAAEPLKGSRIIHVSSTSFGGGVAELLPTQVALLQDLGIDASWQLMEGSEEFFTVTKLVHNALQGAGIDRKVHPQGPDQGGGPGPGGQHHRSGLENAVVGHYAADRVAPHQEGPSGEVGPDLRAAAPGGRSQGHRDRGGIHPAAVPEERS